MFLSLKKIGLTGFCPDNLIYVFAPPQLLLFLKGFTESERNKLAMLTGILLANGNLSASILSSLFNENLVREGVSSHFPTPVCLILVLTDNQKQVGDFDSLLQGILFFKSRFTYCSPNIFFLTQSRLT